MRAAGGSTRKRELAELNGSANAPKRIRKAKAKPKPVGSCRSSTLTSSAAGSCSQIVPPRASACAVSSLIPGLTPGIRLRDFQALDVRRIIRGWEELDTGAQLCQQVNASSFTPALRLCQGCHSCARNGPWQDDHRPLCLALDMSDMRKTFSTMGRAHRKCRRSSRAQLSLWNWKSEIEKFFKDLTAPFAVLVMHLEHSDRQITEHQTELRRYDAIITTLARWHHPHHDLVDSFEYMIVDWPPPPQQENRMSPADDASAAQSQKIFSLPVHQSTMTWRIS